MTGAAPPPAQLPLRIMVVDDSVDDADLIELSLRHAGMVVTCHRVEREATLRDALGSFAPQLVLCDLNLPGFSPARAYALVRDYSLTLPFLCVTGLIDDALAPAPEGVDVLSKDQLDRLPALVRRLLGETSATPQL